MEREQEAIIFYRSISGQFAYLEKELKIENLAFVIASDKNNKKFLHSQPSFSVPEEDRFKRVAPLLQDSLDIIETSSIRLADAEDFIIYQGNNILRVEEQIKHLERELAMRKDEQFLRIQEEHDMMDKLESYFDRISGIGIRYGDGCRSIAHE